MDLLHAGKLFEMGLDILVGKTLNERSEYWTYTLNAKDLKRFLLSTFNSSIANKNEEWAPSQQKKGSAEKHRKSLVSERTPC